MCGIFGVIVKKNMHITEGNIRDIVTSLFKLSESRGKEASGLALLHDNYIDVCKTDIRASRFIKLQEYKHLFSALDHVSILGNSLAIMGHTRLMTNGRQDIFENNHPVIKHGLICVHNGIVVNDSELWKKFVQLNRELEVDTEIIVSLIALFVKETGSFVGGVSRAYKHLKGANSIALFSDISNSIILATNNGSLYIGMSLNSACIIFASERYFITKALSLMKNQKDLSSFKICQILPNQCYEIDLCSLTTEQYDFEDDYNIKKSDIMSCKRNIRMTKPLNAKKHSNLLEQKNHPVLLTEKIRKTVLENREAVASMKRCTTCLLPETFPFIYYDKHGVCSYCLSYKRIEYKGSNALEIFLKRYKKTEEVNCLVGISGGRDSCYGLHYLKTILKMNPIAYTYDWGMVTDLGRRNISRICGELGIEHIVLAADISRKRYYIKKNITAWLKRPELGMVPLFMAGDKQYFYFANRLMKQYGVDLYVMFENRFEKTHFKHGFCGIRYHDSIKPAYSLNFFDKIKLALYYGWNYAYNSSYINASLVDTIWAYISYYVIPHNYLYFYEYIPWKEKDAEETLIKQYGWERSTDIKTTWRIADGTAAFYNFIYYTMAGFTENDTFRSNQIREGLITREEALKSVNEENEPCFESIKWYLDTVNLDFKTTIDRVNSMPKLYRQI